MLPFVAFALFHHQAFQLSQTGAWHIPRRDFDHVVAVSRDVVAIEPVGGTTPVYQVYPNGKLKWLGSVATRFELWYQCVDGSVVSFRDDGLVSLSPTKPYINVEKIPWKSILRTSPRGGLPIVEALDCSKGTVAIQTSGLGLTDPLRAEIYVVRRTDQSVMHSWSVVDGGVANIALSEDGKMLAARTGEDDEEGGIRVYDLGVSPPRVTSHFPVDFWLLDVAFLANGKLTLIGKWGVDKGMRIRVYDLPSTEPRQIDLPMGPFPKLFGGRNFLATDANRVVVLAPNGDTIAEMPCETKNFASLSTVPHENCAFAYEKDGTLRRFEVTPNS